MIELMCCGLAGAKSGLTMGSFYDFSGKKQDVGYFIGAINVGAVVEEQKFKEQSDVILTSIKRITKSRRL